MALKIIFYSDLYPNFTTISAIFVGMQNGKQYLVKYKNLAHVHNRWVPEGVINDTPGGCDLLSLFNKRDHKEKVATSVLNMISLYFLRNDTFFLAKRSMLMFNYIIPQTNWKKEWTEPHHLLRKRPLMPPKEADDFFCSSRANIEHCNVEWLVKWRDLGYEHATWELETACFLRTPQADELKRKYENRRKAAKQSSIPVETKVWLKLILVLYVVLLVLSRVNIIVDNILNKCNIA